MITISDRCKTYDNDVKQAENLLRFKKLIFVLPSVVFVLLSIVLWIATGNAKLLLLVVIPIVYVIAMAIALPQIFGAHCKNIVEQYFKHYGINKNNYDTLMSLSRNRNMNVKNSPVCVIEGDNQGLVQRIKERNFLYVRNEDNALKFVSLIPLAIAGKSYFSSKAGEIRFCAQYDFGYMNIPIEDIDHYRENMMTCSFGADGLCKITFENSFMMDMFIPKKDFYYQTSKKEKED